MDATWPAIVKEAWPRVRTWILDRIQANLDAWRQRLEAEVTRRRWRFR
jgi:hypothetical protein